MVDKILEQEFKKYALCQKNITLGEEVLTGHFEDNPIYPGVLLIEMGLQTTQVMMTDIEKVVGESGNGPSQKAEQGFILSVEKFKFLKTVHPGDVLKVNSSLQSEIVGMVKAEIKITNHQYPITKQTCAGFLPFGYSVIGYWILIGD